MPPARPSILHRAPARGAGVGNRSGARCYRLLKGARLLEIIIREAFLIRPGELGQVFGGLAQELPQPLAILVVEVREQFGLDLVPESIDRLGFALALFGQLDPHDASVSRLRMTFDQLQSGKARDGL